MQPSGLISGALVPLAGRDVDPRFGDPAPGSALMLRTLRLGLCGKLAIRQTALFYAIVYEPWDELERARANTDRWGRFTSLELDWAPWHWLLARAGVQKVAFLLGHDEPEGDLALPVRPEIARALAPDRRLGLSADADLGAARFQAGVFESARSLEDLSSTGVLVVGRARVQPIGPVGAAVSTLHDPDSWLRRPRASLGASFFYEWTPSAQSWSVAGDAQFKWRTLGAAVEYAYAQDAPVERAAGALLRFPRQGLWAELAWLAFRPHVELALRYQWQDATHVPRDTFHAIDAGVSVYELDGAIRVQLFYTRKLHSIGQYDDQVAMLAITVQR